MFKTFCSSKTVINENCDHSTTESGIGLVIGKFSPFTVGHKRLIDALVAECTTQNITPVVYLIDTGVLNGTNRLLTGAERIDAIIAQYGDDMNVLTAPNAFKALIDVKKTGRDLSIVVCGDDRVEMYTELCTLVFGSDYQQHPPKIIPLSRSSNPTDPVSAVSSTIARKLAKTSDINQFMSIVGLSKHPATRLLQLLQSRMTNGTP